MKHPAWCDPSLCMAAEHGPHVTATPPITIGLGRRGVTLRRQLRQGAEDAAPKLFLIIERRGSIVRGPVTYSVIGLTLDQAIADYASVRSLLARAGISETRSS